VYDYSSFFPGIGISVMYANALVILMVCVVETFEVGLKIFVTETIFRFAYYCIPFYY